MSWFKRKELLTPSVADIRNHQKALKYFHQNQSSMGVYGDAADLEDAKVAIRFFAYKNLDHLGDADG